MPCEMFASFWNERNVFLATCCDRNEWLNLKLAKRIGRLKRRRNICKYSNAHQQILYATTGLKCLQIHLIRLYMLPVDGDWLIIISSERKSMPTVQYQMNRKWCKCPVDARIICSKYTCIKIESDGICRPQLSRNVLQTQSQIEWHKIHCKQFHVIKVTRQLSLCFVVGLVDLSHT